MGEYENVFKFAAKAGSLEGYLFHRPKVEPLDNWIDNILDSYNELSQEIKEGINHELRYVLGRALIHGAQVLSPDQMVKIRGLVATIE